jgi:hypothetical protein
MLALKLPLPLLLPALVLDYDGRGCQELKHTLVGWASTGSRHPALILSSFLGSRLAIRLLSVIEKGEGHVS